MRKKQNGGKGSLVMDVCFRVPFMTGARGFPEIHSAEKKNFIPYLGRNFHYPENKSRNTRDIPQKVGQGTEK